MNIKKIRDFSLKIISWVTILFCLSFILSVIFGFLQATQQANCKATAKEDVVQIASAIESYQENYGHFPVDEESTDLVGGKILRSLKGEDVDGLNPRGIVFLQVNPAKKGESGEKDGVFLDPWGVPYEFICDVNVNHEVLAGLNRPHPPKPPPGKVVLPEDEPASYQPSLIRKPVGVWNNPYGVEGIAPAKADRRYVTSWD